MRDIDHETCKSPTGNVSTNHLCSPRANFGYMGKMLVLGACLTDAYLVGWGICESEKVRRGGYHTIKETPIGGEIEQRRCRRLELDGFGRALFEEGSCG